MIPLLKRYWFLCGLLLVFSLTLGDITGTAAGLGQWFGARRGPQAVVVLVFLLSGILIDVRQIKSGLRDVTATLTALAVMFVLAPLLAALLGGLPLKTGICIGLFLVAVMPTTLSSGVVMTAAAGGNMAHALFVTILANGMAVVTIPISLALLLPLIGGQAEVAIDTGRIVLTLVSFVLVPLTGGLLLKQWAGDWPTRRTPALRILNQCLILAVVWMGFSQSRSAIIAGGSAVGLIVLLAVVFHGLLVAAGVALSAWFGVGRGRRESVIFMGAQKTLPLSIMLQVALFPGYADALVFCVVHHVVHLMMDSWLVVRLRR
jgi:sodium/bile acid cotransporter 7